MVKKSPPLLRCALSGITVFGATALLFGASEAAELAAFHGWGKLGLDWLELEAWSRQQPFVPAGIIGLLFAALMLLCETRKVEGGVSGAMRGVNAFLGFPWTPLVAAVVLLTVPQALATARRPLAPVLAPNVLFVLLDTWRADHTGFLGYERPVSPILDRLVEEGVVFEHAMSSTGWTKPAVASLFTGLIPSRHGAVSQPLPHTPVRGAFLQPPVTTFVEIFRARGWDTAMWSNNPNITPPRGFDQGAGYFRDYYHDPKKSSDFDPGRAERMIPDVEAWLEERRGAERPFMAYLHVMDPHYPYVAPDPFAGTFDTTGSDFQLDGHVCRELMTGKRTLADFTPEMRQRILDIYDEELLYVDKYVGEFLQRIRTDYPDTVIVLSGDHGEEFLEHGNYGHGHAIYNELSHVPLVIWAPGLEPMRVSYQVRLMDVMPTLLELAGLESSIPPGIQGETLTSFFDGSEADHRLAPIESGGDQKPAWQWRAISDGKYKYLRREKNLPTRKPIPPLSPDENTDDFPLEFLFDLEAAPTEQVNLLGQGARWRETADELFQQMKERDWYVLPTELLRMSTHTIDMSERDAKGLDALGYGGGDEQGLDGHHH